MNKKHEQVLCLVHNNYPSPLKPSLDLLKGQEPGIWVHRGLCETTPMLKQVIPYIVLYDLVKDQYVAYARKSGDDRLVGQSSIGIGGHINRVDAVNAMKYNYSIFNIITEAAKREYQEELKCPMPNIDIWNFFRGFIYSNNSDVDSVHLGLVFLVPVSIDEKFCFIDEEHVFSPVSYTQLIDNRAKGMYESWSEIVIDSVINKKTRSEFIGA